MDKHKESILSQIWNPLKLQQIKYEPKLTVWN